MGYLLDTNIVSEPLRSEPTAEVVQWLRDHEGESAIPAPVWHELWFGCARLRLSRRRKVLERYLKDVVLANFPILAYDYRSADWHAIERARLSLIEKTPPFVDGQIAAIACVNDLTVVTANAADFRGFRDLRVHSWDAA